MKREGTFHSLAQEMEGDAMRVLEQILCCLNDETMDDPKCFHRIETIVETFYASGIHTSRHEWD